MTSTRTRGDYDRPARHSTALTVNMFAGVMLLILGALQVLQGVAAALDDEVFVRGVKYTYKLDLTAWGWIHIVVGAIAVAVALGILAGQAWGQVAGIGVAGLSVLANFTWLPYYPLWALVLIAFDVFVIWALCTQLSAGRPD
jgi:hypothetical protein